MNPRYSPAPAQVCFPSSFSRQPPRILIVDVSHPWWSDIYFNICEALDNFLTLACNVDGPTRLPLLSIYAVSSHLECLLPFVVKGNLGRLRSCVEELRAMPREGCTRPLGSLFSQAVKDSVLQFKQHTRHASPSSAMDHSSVEVTIVTCRPGRAVLKQLEEGLKETDLASLRRLLVVHVVVDAGILGGHMDWSTTSSPSVEEAEDSLMLATEMEVQQVDNDSIALESNFKVWLHDQGGEREHIHLLLPPSVQGNNSDPLQYSKPSPVCIKCDVQERLLSPALFPSVSELGGNTERLRDLQLPTKGQSSLNVLPHRLTAIKTLKSDGLCESVLYGLPQVIRPTNCWQQDWDELETNQHLFHALCHILRSHECFLLVRCEPHVPAGPSPGFSTSPRLFSYFVLQPSTSLTLLVKPVVGRELLLPCHMPMGSLSHLEEDSAFNPLGLKTNLYPHLRSRVSRPAHPYRLQRREQQHRPEGRPVKQPPGRHPASRVRAAVAPLQSSAAKVSRPALTMNQARASHHCCDVSDDANLPVML